MAKTKREAKLTILAGLLVVVENVKAVLFFSFLSQSMLFKMEGQSEGPGTDDGRRPRGEYKYSQFPCSWAVSTGHDRTHTYTHATSQIHPRPALLRTDL